MTPDAMARMPRTTELTLSLMPPIRGHFKGNPPRDKWPMVYRALQRVMLELIADGEARS